MVEQTKSTTSSAPIPSPPRRTGNAEADNLALMQWTNDFYKIAIVQGNLVQKAEYIAAQQVIEGQVDPARATAATAQKTANEAQLLANTAENRAQSVQDAFDLFGTIEISNTNNFATHTFDKAQTDDQYNIVLSALSSTGSPNVNAFIVIEQSYTAENFSVTLNQAPGAGSSVVYNWHLRRKVEA